MEASQPSPQMPIKLACPHCNRSENLLLGNDDEVLCPNCNTRAWVLLSRKLQAQEIIATARSLRQTRTPTVKRPAAGASITASMKKKEVVMTQADLAFLKELAISW